MSEVSGTARVESEAREKEMREMSVRMGSGQTSASLESGRMASAVEVLYVRAKQ